MCSTYEANNVTHYHQQWNKQIYVWRWEAGSSACMWKAHKVPFATFLISTPQNQSTTLSLHSQYMLFCSFVLKSEQTSLFSTRICLRIQMKRKQRKSELQTHGTTAKGLSAHGIKPHPRSWGLIIDVSSHKFSRAFQLCKKILREKIQAFFSPRRQQIRKCRKLNFNWEPAHLL